MEVLLFLCSELPFNLQTTRTKYNLTVKTMLFFRGQQTYINYQRIPSGQVNVVYRTRCHRYLGANPTSRNFFSTKPAPHVPISAHDGYLRLDISCNRKNM